MSRTNAQPYRLLNASSDDQPFLERWQQAYVLVKRDISRGHITSIMWPPSHCTSVRGLMQFKCDACSRCMRKAKHNFQGMLCKCFTKNKNNTCIHVYIMHHTLENRTKCDKGLLYALLHCLQDTIVLIRPNLVKSLWLTKHLQEPTIRTVHFMSHSFNLQFDAAPVCIVHFIGWNGSSCLAQSATSQLTTDDIRTTSQRDRTLRVES